jgi:predicted nucleic acid-binding protein
MMDDKTVVVDTNVLLSASDPQRALHRTALEILNNWPNQGQILAISAQVLREYLAVATRPVNVNGLGLDVHDALANVAAFRGRMRLIWETEQTWDRLHGLISRYRCSGKQVHDANVVATALTSGVTRLLTANVADFSRFSPELEIIDLAAVSEG